MTNQISLVWVVFTAALALLHLIYRWWWNFHGGQRRINEENQEAKLPPGTTGWPLIGETFSYSLSMASNHPRKFVDEREKRYGSDIFKSHLFGDRVVVSADPQFNKFVMQNEGRLFQTRNPKALRGLIGKYGLLEVHGDLQRKLHGIAVNLLNPERRKSNFMEEIQNLVHSTLDRWADMKEIVLQNECRQMVLNLMAKQLLGLSPSKETSDIGQLFVDFTNAVVSFPIKFPGSTYAKGIKARELLIRKIAEIIEERRKHPKVAHHDFLEEHDALLMTKDGQKMDWDDYKSMKFTQCVINETLRLGNFASGVFRQAKEDIKVKDYLIPKGWVIYAFLTATHLNENYHRKALIFDPWRWQLYQGLDDSSYTPFGVGGRHCPGSHLAKLELAHFLHTFVKRFRWEMLANDHISYFPLPHLTKGFPIRLFYRE